MKKNITVLTHKDYVLISFIAISFSIFTIPIIKNILPIEITSLIILAEIVVFLILANIALWIAGLIAKKIPVILQMAKFVAVGIFNTFLDWGIVNLLMLITQIFAGFWYPIFNVISFIFANIGSFFWSRYWIFAKDKKIRNQESGAKDFLQFFVVSVIGLGIKVGIATLLVNYVTSPVDEKIWANIGLVFGTSLSMIWNFLGYKFIVFKK